MYGWDKTRQLGPHTTLYIGDDVRFRLIGARFNFRIQGKAIFLSAIARGQGYIDGTGDPAVGRAAPVPPVWLPGPGRVLAYSDGRRTIVYDETTGRVLRRASPSLLTRAGARIRASRGRVLPIRAAGLPRGG